MLVRVHVLASHSTYRTEESAARILNVSAPQHAYLKSLSLKLLGFHGLFRDPSDIVFHDLFTLNRKITHENPINILWPWKIVVLGSRNGYEYEAVS